MQRRESTGIEVNTNGNNSKGLGSYISDYARSTENSNRTNSSRIPGGGLRMKSNLVGSMAATFEQRKKDSLPPSGVSTIKSSSFNRLEGSTAVASEKVISNDTVSSRMENGTTNRTPKQGNKTTNYNSKTTDTPKLESGKTSNSKQGNEADGGSEQSVTRAKSSSSSRRGKQQRERRMLRQKRRSTGVIRLKESDDEGEEEKKGDKDPNENEEVTRTFETEKNTLSNELSSPLSASIVKAESERTQCFVTTDGNSSILKSRSVTSSFASHSCQTRSNVLSAGSTSQTSNMPMLNSSKTRGEKSQQDSNENHKLRELREKLSAAESTIDKLTKEVGGMEANIKNLAGENHKLKRENKLLADENTSMLMLLTQLKSGRE